MKITRVEPLHIGKYLFVQVHTDAGITGLGESGAVGVLEASAAMLEMAGRYLVGKDPLRIAHHFEYMYRSRHVPDFALMGALSAVDIALWDIAGKHYGVPVHRLLGGPTRDRVRVYHHVFGDTRIKLIDGILAVKEKGFKAVGHLTAFLDEPRTKQYAIPTHVRRMSGAVDAVAMYRDAVGSEVDLCIELHRSCTPNEAVQLGRAIEGYFPYFLEDPARPDNIDVLEHVASKANVPIATGERLFNLWQFEMLINRRAVSYIRPNICIVGGFTGAIKIAALAEANYIGVVPHNPISPVSTAACLQLAAAIPNFALLEYSGAEHQPPRSLMVTAPAKHDGDGNLLVPTTSGIGVELNPAALEAVPPYRRDFLTRIGNDGSVIDQ